MIAGISMLAETRPGLGNGVSLCCDELAWLATDKDSAPMVPREGAETVKTVNISKWPWVKIGASMYFLRSTALRRAFLRYITGTPSLFLAPFFARISSFILSLHQIQPAETSKPAFNMCCIPCFPYSDVDFEEEPRAPRRGPEAYQYVWNGQNWVLQPYNSRRRRSVSAQPLFFCLIIPCQVIYLGPHALCPRPPKLVSVEAPRQAVSTGCVDRLCV